MEICRLSAKHEAWIIPASVGRLCVLYELIDDGYDFTRVMSHRTHPITYGD